MDNQFPTQQPPSAPAQKQKSLPIMLLAVLAILLFLSTLFLAYQNRQLKQQITLLKQSSSPTPTPEGDPIANWSIYTNNDHKLSFRYPNDLIINDIADSPSYIKNPNISLGFNLIDPVTHAIKIVFTIHKSNLITDLPPSVGAGLTAMINGLEVTIYHSSGDMIPDQTFVRITGKDGKIYQFSYTQSLRDPSIIDKILYTFKFLDKPIVQPTGKFCGGIAAFPCPAGFTCTLDGDFPDAGGTCIANPTHTCPTSGWVDCMPGPDAKPECSPEAMNWYKANCPNFQGGAM